MTRFLQLAEDDSSYEVNYILGVNPKNISYVVGYEICFCLCKKKPNSLSSDETPAAEAASKYSIEELKTTTNNFSPENIVSIGGYSTVYKGRLQNGTMVAIKKMKLNRMTEKGLAEFKSEIDALSKINHRHFLSPLGFYLDDNERLLVYELMPKGTLSEHLFGRRGVVVNPLDWITRLRIAVDIAKVEVEYLPANEKDAQKFPKKNEICWVDEG
ncbi:receptor-like kinase TMK3 [Papaver somniferum]|uniref:receptor-like kinase TMK3 n=1 Tax=Papaver somniferum TaxID=3469 RepID=UPI000E6FD7F0|nr:receptor-like kinase TMK3 [Papaver somniferum]